MSKSPLSEEAATLREMRTARGHTIDDMLQSLGMTAREFRSACQKGEARAIVERYEKIVTDRPKGTHAENMQKLRELRAERGHTFIQMCRVLDMPETAYQRLRNAGRLHDVIREYEKIPIDAARVPAGWAALTDAEIGKKMSTNLRQTLPPVGSVLQRGDQKATVLRHTSADSILVEWRDGEGKTRRAEWTTTPHPRCTDRGDWRVQK